MTLPNPTVPGFHPDPSITRVGEDYYLACSSFEYLPGLPLFHSRDLVHWEQIGNVVTRPGQLALEKVPTLGGAWAPTIRFHDGRFWLVVTNAMGRGSLIFTADRAEGPWSDGIVMQGGPVSTRTSPGTPTAPVSSPIRVCSSTVTEPANTWASSRSVWTSKPARHSKNPGRCGRAPD